MIPGINRLLLTLLALSLLTGCETGEVGTLDGWEEVAPEGLAMEESKLLEASRYAEGSGLIVRDGKVVFRWGDPDRLYKLKSASKAIGITALGLAIKDGLVSLTDKLQQHCSGLSNLPESRHGRDWIDHITLLNLATQTAGFDKPGGYVPLMFKPGTGWAYSDSGPNWLADCLTIIYGKDLKDLMFERVFTPLGIAHSDLRWRDNLYREQTINGIKRREFGGISANVNAMARIGYLYLQGGRWQQQQIIPQGFVKRIRTTPAGIYGVPVINDTRSRFAGASKHYGLLWWNNADGAIEGVPRDAYWAWGLRDSLIVVIPSLDIVISRAGEPIPGSRNPSYYAILEPFLQTIAASVKLGAPSQDGPVISAIAGHESPSTAIQ